MKKLYWLIIMSFDEYFHNKVINHALDNSTKEDEIKDLVALTKIRSRCFNRVLKQK